MKENADQLQLIPPYCPNFNCKFHKGTKERFYVKNGFTFTSKAPYLNQRYRCRECKTQFSSNTFDLDFRKKNPGHSEKILNYTMNSMSNNSVARNLKVSEGLVRDRIKMMARQSLLFEKKHSPKVIEEDVSYDGFETFTHSQFSPCYINTAVGRGSHFIYHNTFSPLNRKGRMTEYQKVKNQELIKKHGLYPKHSVYEESSYIMQEISKKTKQRTLYTDEHKAYLKAFKRQEFNFKHITINSQERRDASNPLFPINHLHMLYRHFLSSQKRESISFKKHEGSLLEKVQLMKVYRNYMSPKFVKKNKIDPHAHEWSPAMYLKITEKILNFNEVFGTRIMESQMDLDQREKNFMARHYPYSRQIIVP